MIGGQSASVQQEQSHCFCFASIGRARLHAARGHAGLLLQTCLSCENGESWAFILVIFVAYD